MQTWKSLLIEGTVRSCVGKSSGLGGHVTCSGTKRFQEEDRKAREAARLCCNTPQQTTGPVDTAAGFFSRPESVRNSQFHSSDGSRASPTHSLKKPLPSLHLPSSKSSLRKFYLLSVHPACPARSMEKGGQAVWVR